MLTPRNLSEVSGVTWGDLLANPNATIAVRELVMKRMADKSNTSLALSEGIDPCGICTLVMPVLVHSVTADGCGLLYDVRHCPVFLPCCHVSATLNIFIALVHCCKIFTRS